MNSGSPRTMQFSMASMTCGNSIARRARFHLSSSWFVTVRTTTSLSLSFSKVEQLPRCDVEIARS